MSVASVLNYLTLHKKIFINYFVFDEKFVVNFHPEFQVYLPQIIFYNADVFSWVGHCRDFHRADFVGA